MLLIKIDLDFRGPGFQMTSLLSSLYLPKNVLQRGITWLDRFILKTGSVRNISLGQGSWDGFFFQYSIGISETVLLHLHTRRINTILRPAAVWLHICCLSISLSLIGGHLPLHWFKAFIIAGQTFRVEKCLFFGLESF